MNRFPVLFVLIGMIFMMPCLAWAQRVDSPPDQSPSGVNVHIAAVINDNIISTEDLEARIKLAMLSAGLPSTSEVAQRLLPQVMRSLIDEQLEAQEAKRLDITISKQDIDNALDRIAKDNNIPGGDMKAFVASHGVPAVYLETQIRNAMAWNKVVQRELRPLVDVGDDEVDAAVERMRANAGKQEYLVNEIYLAVDNPQDEEQVKQFAENLVQQIKEGGNFGAIARQFSQGTGAAAGGDIGWIQEGQLSSELDHALTSMQPGETNGPIRTASGFHVLNLREKRTISAGGDPGEITLGLQQAFHPLDPNANQDALLQEAAHMQTAINSCTNLQSQLAEKYPGWRLQNMGEVKLAKIPSWAADKIRDVPAGRASNVLPTDKGALIFFVCDRHVPDGDVDRNAIVNSIGTEKLELQARRLLRDLRRQAYMDIRLSHQS